MGFPSMGTVTPMSSYNDPPPPYTPPLTPRRDPVGLRPPKQASGNFLDIYCPTKHVFLFLQICSCREWLEILHSPQSGSQWTCFRFVVVQDLTPDRSLTPPIDSGPNKAQLAAQLQREAEDIVTVRQMHKLQLIRAEAQRTAVSC